MCGGGWYSCVLFTCIEGHISQHDLAAISGTGVADNIDQKTLAAFADLRGRVVWYIRQVSRHNAAMCSFLCSKYFAAQKTFFFSDKDFSSPLFHSLDFVRQGNKITQ